MERSGMKWTERAAQGLLNLRCLRVSGLWEQFHKERSKSTPESQLSSQRETPVTSGGRSRWSRRKGFAGEVQVPDARIHLT